MNNDRFAELTGIELIRNENGQPMARLEIKEQHLNGLQTAQGGSIFTLADYAFAIASNNDRRISVALNISTHFINAAKLGDVLTTRVRELSRKRIISVYEITVVNQDDKTIATFIATAYKVGDQGD
jgi:acyl-CoA thioesterase